MFSENAQTLWAESDAQSRPVASVLRVSLGLWSHEAIDSGTRAVGKQQQRVDATKAE